MPFLTFSAFLPDGKDITMKDDSSSPLHLPDVNMPITFDFDFELDEPNLTLGLDTEFLADNNDVELRSPRTPTYQGDDIEDDGSQSPLDADKFFKFPLISPSHEQSPLASLTYASDTRSHCNSHASFAESKENLSPLRPPPKIPLLWIWTCHLCRSRWPLGVTRRCLVDGHFYCSGDNSTITQRNVKKKKKGQACSSEFDYVGWQGWANWKKDAIASKKRALAGPGATSINFKLCLRGCEGCEYPSQCRYERLNQVPDVVAAVSKKSNQGENTKIKTTNTATKATNESNTDKRRSLKIDTGLVSDQKSKVKSNNNNNVSSNDKKTLIVIPGLNLAPKDPEGPSSTQVKQVKSGSPTSPGLIDFSKITTGHTERDPNPTLDGTNREDANEINAMLVDDDKGTTPDSCYKTATGNSGAKTAVLMGSARATRIMSRKEDRSRESNEVKQSRISDFFGIAK